MCDVFIMIDFKAFNFLIVGFSQLKNLTKLSKLFEEASSQRAFKEMKLNEESLKSNNLI